MSEEEIKKLSRELAQTLHDDNTLFFSASWTNTNPIDCKAYELEKTLEVLLRDYCIVPKDKARGLCKLTFENGGSIDYGLIDGLTDWVCENFNDEYHDIVDNGE